MPMSESSSLASVVCNQMWKADDKTPLALFHKKFWGKSMKDEESEWRMSQIRMDQDQDDSEITDMEDDIVPGCYVLDISIPGLQVSHLWIRADYIRIFDFFKAFYDEYARPMTKVPSGVLTGQPGIGKSLWLYYAARRCAAEMKPFIWFYKAKYYLFVNEGVYRLPDDWTHDDFLCIIWTLVDSDQCKEGVPPNLIPHGTLLFVIYATYPAKHRWSRMDKTTHSVVVIMNPWGRKEIKRAANLTPLKNITEGHIDETFDLLGPVPRLCIEFASQQLERYKEELDMALSSITVDEIEKMFNDASVLSMDAVLHKICLFSRKQQDDLYSRAVVAPITPSVQSRLAARFRNLHQAEQIRLYKYFERVPESRKLAGIFYEAIVQSYLQNGRILEFVPMVTLEEKKRKRSEDGPQHQPEWYSSHIIIHNPTLELCRLKVSKGIKVDIRPNRILEYSDNGLQSIEPNVFYVPEMTNQKALDSFILLDGLLYIFQITVGMRHDVNHGLIDVADKYSFPPRDQWRFVFIIPPNMTLTVPRPWRLTLRDLSPYSAVVDVDPVQVQ